MIRYHSRKVGMYMPNTPPLTVTPTVNDAYNFTVY